MSYTFEVRRDGETLLHSTVHRGGYTKLILLALMSSGYKLYENGKVLTKKALMQEE